MSENDNRSWIAAAVGATLFGGALLVLHRELAALHYHELTRDLFAMPGRRLALAVLLTAANYVVLTGYDLAAHIDTLVAEQRVASRGKAAP